VVAHGYRQARNRGRPVDSVNDYVDQMAGGATLGQSVPPYRGPSSGASPTGGAGVRTPYFFGPF